MTDVRVVYTIHLENMETGERWKRHVQIEELGVEGVEILNGVCSVLLTQEQAEQAFRDWSDEIQIEATSV